MKRTDRGSPSAALMVSFCALFVALSGIALALQANSVRSIHIVNGAVSTADLGHGAVKTKQLARRAVTAEKLRPGAVGPAQLGRGSVDGSKVIDGSLSGEHIQDVSIGPPALAAGSVGGDRIASNAVNSPKVATGSLSEDRLAPSAVDLARLASNSVNSAKVANNSLIGADINEATLGSPLVRNVTQHVATFPTDSGASISEALDCPAGKVLLGGGATINPSGVTNVFFRSNAPAPEALSTRWRTVAQKVPTDGAPWSLTIHVICANA